MRRGDRYPSVAVFAAAAMFASMALLPIGAGASAMTTPIWSRAFTPPNGAMGTAIAVGAADHTVYVGGATSSAPNEFLVAAYTMGTGQRRWLGRYPCSDVTSDGCRIYPNSLALSPDGTTLYFTGGDQTGSHTRDMVTMALDPVTGEARWSSRSRNVSDGAAPRMAPSPSGDRIFVAGPVGPDLRQGERVVAYEAINGALLWHIRTAGSAVPQTSIGVSPDGRRVFTSVGSVGTSHVLKTLALDATTGSILWTQRYDSRTGDDYGSDLAVDPGSGRVYVTDYREGYMPGGEGARLMWPLTIAYGASHGRLLWQRVEHGAFCDSMYFGVAAGRGRVFVTNGYAIESRSGRTGRAQWLTKTVGMPHWSDFDFHLAASADGRMVLASEPLTSPSGDAPSRLETVALNASSGAIRSTAVRRGVLWGEAVAGPNAARVYVVATMPDGSGGYRGMLVMAYRA